MRFRPAQPGGPAAVEGRLDGDGGVARAVESQRLTVAGMSRVTGDDPGQVVWSTEVSVTPRWKKGNMRR